MQSIPFGSKWGKIAYWFECGKPKRPHCQASISRTRRLLLSSAAFFSRLNKLILTCVFVCLI